MFILLLLVNSIASSINHIDDTDETYGYWEPLHYLLFGKGMQTWEYSPEFSLRTYVFIVPLSLLCQSVQLLVKVPTRLTIFFAAKLGFGIISSLCQTAFLTSIKVKFGYLTQLTTFSLMIFCPGIFYMSTAYLPSAFCSFMLMIAISCWIYRKYDLVLLTGCIAVLWTGWPFIAVAFVPLGLHMLYDCYQKGIQSAMNIILMGILILTTVSLVSLFVDSHFYGRWTFPPLNILLYNAVGGHGDELYGTEPASYYVKALFLNTVLVAPFAVVACGLLCKDIILLFLHSSSADFQSKVVDKLVIFSPAILWLLILFSRPHKEERFLYPIYPLFSLMASSALNELASMASVVVSAMITKRKLKDEARENVKINFVKNVLILVVVFISALMGTSRITSNYINYSGYLRLWQRIAVSTELQALPRDGSLERNYCMGASWFTFPSHFFLPDKVNTYCCAYFFIKCSSVYVFLSDFIAYKFLCMDFSSAVETLAQYLLSTNPVLTQY